MKLSELAEAAGGEIKGKDLGTEISSIECSTHFVGKDSLFCCIEGFKADGHNFTAQAAAKGACAFCVSREIDTGELPQIIVPDTRKAFAVMSSAFLCNPSDSLTVIGVTGTNGKTTVTFMLDHILEQNGISSGLMGTLYTKIGDRKIISDVTTPDAGTLQKNLALMLSEKITAAVFEVSSHALELDRVYGCNFDRAVFTNLTQDHLDFHKDFGEYFKAKKKLFDSLADSHKKSAAIVNIDDPWGEKIVSSLAVPVFTYAIDKKADFTASGCDVKAEGISYRLSFKDKDYSVKLPVSGFFNIYNSLAAIACCASLGIELEKVIEALQSFRGVKGRFETVKCGQDFAAVVDYAHTPDGLYNVLKTAKSMTKGRVISVFGCGGDRDKTKRPLMGKIAAQLSDYAFITSDNPRTEEPEKILDDIIAGLPPGFDSYTREADRRKAINSALVFARSGDIVVVAGKGHEDYQIIGTEKRHFDDAQEIRDFFGKCAENELLLHSTKN